MSIAQNLDGDFGLLLFSYDGGSNWSRFTNNSIAYAVKVTSNDHVCIYDMDGSEIKLPNDISSLINLTNDHKERIEKMFRGCWNITPLVMTSILGRNQMR